MDQRIFLFKEDLPDNLQEHWTIEKMAETVGISASYFQMLFKKDVGIPPMSYLHDLRLEKARELLKQLSII